MDQSNAELKKIIPLLTKEFKAKKIFLFGSQARGDIHENSDYDLLLVVEESSLTPLQRMEKAQDLLWNTSLPAADIFILTEKEFEKSVLDFGSIAESAISEGQEIRLDLFT